MQVGASSYLHDWYQEDFFLDQSNIHGLYFKFWYPILYINAVCQILFLFFSNYPLDL